MGPVVSSPHSLGVLNVRNQSQSWPPYWKASRNSLDNFVKVVPRHRPRRLGRLGQPTPLTRLPDRPSDQTRPTVLMVGTESTAVVAVEELVEEQVVPEVGVPVQFGVSTVACSSALFVSCKDVDQPMLDLFRGTGQGDILSQRRLATAALQKKEHHSPRHYLWDTRPVLPRRNTDRNAANSR